MVYATVLAFEVILFSLNVTLNIFDMAVVHVFIFRDCCNNSCGRFIRECVCACVFIKCKAHFYFVTWV